MDESPHTHTCTECLAAYACTPQRAATHGPDCDCADCADWLWCTGSDGDGRCPACARAAFDNIGKHGRDQTS